MKFLLIILATLACVSLSAEQLDSMQEYIMTKNCRNHDKDSCQKLIDNGLPSVAECGKDESCSWIGAIYHLAGHSDKAAQYWAKSCDSQSPNIKEVARGCYNLGAYYAQNKQFDKSFALHQKVCDNFEDSPSSISACNSVASFYKRGDGTKQDFALAVKYYQKAIDLSEDFELDDPRPFYNLAELQESGKGTPKNLTQAKENYKRVCKPYRNFKDSCQKYESLQKQSK
ncbi:tetratricopeptide repeat protein [Helicobacter sp. T3_23-1056]